jgi:hypothetical protein
MLLLQQAECKQWLLLLVTTAGGLITIILGLLSGIL